VLKALCCSMVVFVAIGAIGVWLRLNRRDPRR
jgi:hypothetical protein